MRTVIVPPGIGDSLWVLMKLVNSGERFRFLLPDISPRRGKQVFDLLPQIAVSANYQEGLTYRKIEMASIHRFGNRFKSISRDEFCLSANKWLEAGVRLEQFLPDLPISYRLEYATTQEDVRTAESILYNGFNDKGLSPLFGIYASAYSNARHWDGWDAEKWITYAKRIHNSIPDMAFVVIGAEYDTDLSTQILDGLQELSIPCINTVGQPLSVVVEILKRLSYFTGFPSGLSILNETLGKDGTMFYPASKSHVANIMGTWADPARLKSGNFKECLFPDPTEMADWVLQEYNLSIRLHREFVQKAEEINNELAKTDAGSDDDLPFESKPNHNKQKKKHHR